MAEKISSFHSRYKNDQMVSVMNGNKDVPHGHGGVMGGGGKINSIIRLTHLLLQRLRRAPSPRLLHTIITRLFASAAACDEDNGKGCECEREKICPPPGVGIRGADLLLLSAAGARSVCFAHSRRQGQERPLPARYQATAGIRQCIRFSLRHPTASQFRNH